MFVSSVTFNLERKKENYKASFAILRGNSREFSTLEDQLHPDERSVYQSYLHDRRKTSYILGRIVAKSAILKLMGQGDPSSICIDSGVFLFPVVKYLKNGNIQVSISHNEDVGVSLAFPEDHPLGIDIEKIEPNKLDVLLSQVTHSEKVQLAQFHKDDISGYVSIFSMKESLSKILKTGMMLDFKYLSLENIKLKGRLIIAEFQHFGQYKAMAFQESNRVFSIVLPKRTSISAKDLEKIFRVVSACLR